MAAQQPTAEDQVHQLGNARRLVLQDPAYWPQVLQGTLPIISGPSIEVRRWGADFLAETFSTPIVDTKVKQEMVLTCLDTLLMLAGETEAGILKSVVQCSASVYPLVFRHICSNRHDTDAWSKTVAIKTRVLGLWDTGPVGVRIACIKFVQRVVLVQSRGVTDPRLVDRSDTSLASVPASHPLLSLPALDAEAQGLLDRLLSILHEDPSDASLVTATLNNLSALIKLRPPMAPKVVNAVLSFNPLAGAARGLTVGNRLMMVSMEKTTRVLLLNVMRANPQGPFTQRITHYLQRMSQAKAELNEEASRKRAAPSQDFETTKRLKVEKVPTPKPTPEPTPPHPAQQVITGPFTYAQLYTLTTDPAMTTFDGSMLPLELVIQIVVGSLMSADQQRLNATVAAVRDRYTALLSHAAPPSAIPSQANTPLRGTPAAEPPDKLALAKREPASDEVALELGEFRLPPPPPLPAHLLRTTALSAIDRMFATIEEFEKTSLIARKSKLGVSRLAASNWDREGWITVIVRLATRGGADPQTADAVRERLFSYIIADFRGRMDVATAWLNEEWYNDKLNATERVKPEVDGDEKALVKKEEDNGETEGRQPQYEKWMMRLMEAIFPFVEAKDRTFLRMLSEIPEVTKELLGKVRVLCLDPDRTSLGIQMLHYLAMLRPPVREGALDVLEDLYKNQPELQKSTQKILQKWRPQALQQRIGMDRESPAVKKEEPASTSTSSLASPPHSSAAPAEDTSASAVVNGASTGSPTSPVPGAPVAPINA